MKPLSFEWDQRKDRSNQKNHGIVLSEGQTVFYDENAVEFFDPDHSEEENRFIPDFAFAAPSILVNTAVQLPLFFVHIEDNPFVLSSFEKARRIAAEETQ